MSVAEDDSHGVSRPAAEGDVMLNASSHGRSQESLSRPVCYSVGEGSERMIDGGKPLSDFLSHGKAAYEVLIEGGSAEVVMT